MKRQSDVEAARLKPIVEQQAGANAQSIDLGITKDLNRHQLRSELLGETASGAEQLAKIRTQNALNPGLFSEAEMKLLSDRQVAQSQVVNLTNAQLESQKVMGESVGTNLAKGAAAVGLTMVADHYFG